MGTVPAIDLEATPNTTARHVFDIQEKGVECIPLPTEEAVWRGAVPPPPNFFLILGSLSAYFGAF